LRLLSLLKEILLTLLFPLVQELLIIINSFRVSDIELISEKYPELILEIIWLLLIGRILLRVPMLRFGAESLEHTCEVIIAS
jgi:hypothetical protein